MLKRCLEMARRIPAKRRRIGLLHTYDEVYHGDLHNLCVRLCLTDRAGHRRAEHVVCAWRSAFLDPVLGCCVTNRNRGALVRAGTAVTTS